MALVDPYSPCPCGSDKKFKWCCQKAEPYVEKSNRLAENGQYDAAISVLDEGLAKDPDNPWLLLRKAFLLVAAEARGGQQAVVDACSRKQPDHLGAAVLQTRFALANEGPVAAAAELAAALSTTPSHEARAGLARVVAIVAARAGQAPPLSRRVQAFRARAGDRIATETITSSLRSLPGQSAASLPG